MAFCFAATWSKMMLVYSSLGKSQPGCQWDLTLGVVSLSCTCGGFLRDLPDGVLMKFGQNVTIKDYLTCVVASLVLLGC